MSQLRMIYNLADNPLMELPPIPTGFALRAATVEDAEEYLDLRVASGFSVWKVEDFTKHHDNEIVADGIRVVEDLSTKRLVAASSAQHGYYQDVHPDWGGLGWVLSRPEYRGKGLGWLASASVMRYLKNAGYKKASLLTDDWRLPALKLYLRMGWRPWLVEDDMPGRWKDICDKLNYDYDNFEKYDKDII